MLLFVENGLIIANIRDRFFFISGSTESFLRWLCVHELSIVQGVVDICQSSAGGRRVTSVTLEIGELSGVVPEAVEFCFEACSRGTPLDGARLIIDRIPAAARCPTCGATFDIHAYYDPCPACGAYAVIITAGEELRVRELEVA